MSPSLKRKGPPDDSGSGQAKKARVDSVEGQAITRNEQQTRVVPQPVRTGKEKAGTATVASAVSNTSHTQGSIADPAHRPMRKETVRKLAPPRPFPSVPPAVSASGPKSAHKEGKNFICITRHSPLAAYLNRCKKILVDEGYQTLHLHAMGAAIPHLLMLSVSLPPILPFARDEIKTEVRTGTIEVMDEIVPEDEDEDVTMRTRGKGGVSVVIQIRGGKTLPEGTEVRTARNTGAEAAKRQVIVVQEQEQEDEEMSEDGEIGD